MQQHRTIAREIGTAFAVLAIYLLTVLAPLHHSRASQLDFAELGYATLDAGWVLCAADGATGEDREVLATKCPATGLGKQDVMAPSPVVIALASGMATLAAPLGRAAPLSFPAPATPPIGSRAPPAIV